MSKVDHILIGFECVLPRERVVIARVLALHRVLVVADVLAAASPALTLRLGGVF